MRIGRGTPVSSSSDTAEYLWGCCRFPCVLLSGTEGRAGRGLRESWLCGIKIIFARVAELVDALDLESSGLSIRVQVPSLAPEFARTSPAWLRDVFVLGLLCRKHLSMVSTGETKQLHAGRAVNSGPPCHGADNPFMSQSATGSCCSIRLFLRGNSRRCRSRSQHDSIPPAPCA